jgi:zinc protease
MKIISICLAAFVYGCSSSSSITKHVNFDVHEKVYENGLKVLVVENHKLPIFNFTTFYEVGGKFEQKGATGATHFLEHMMFKGAKKYGANKFDDVVEGNGGNNNAYTTNDLTVYYENLPSEHLDTIIDVEADRMNNLLLEKKSFESERLVVLEERKMRYENSDRGKIYLEMMQKMFEGTPYGTSVIGDVQDLKTVTRDKFFEYFKTFYVPNNAVVLIVGDVDKDHVFKEIEKRFGTIKKNKGLEKLKRETLANKDFSFKGKYGGREIKLKGTSSNPNFMYAFQGVKIGSKDSYALDILSTVLGGSMSSYLNEAFVLSNRPTMASIYAANYTLQESGVFFIGGQLLSGVDPHKAKESLYKEIQEVCSEKLIKRSLEKVKNQYLVSSLSGLDTNAGIAKYLGNYEVYYGDYNFYKKELEIYNNVSLEDVRSVCRKYLVKENSIFLSIWNKN